MNPVQTRINKYREGRKELFKKAAKSSIELETNRMSIQVYKEELFRGIKSQNGNPVLKALVKMIEKKETEKEELYDKWAESWAKYETEEVN